MRRKKNKNPKKTVTYGEKIIKKLPMIGFEKKQIDLRRQTKNTHEKNITRGGTDPQEK